MNKYILISISILLYSCGSGESNQSSSGSGYCDCLYTPNETDKKRVIEEYHRDGKPALKKYWDENTQQVVEESWDYKGNLSRRTTWKCYKRPYKGNTLGTEYEIENIKYHENGSIRDHQKYDECGGEVFWASYDKEGNLSSEYIRHGIEDIYSFYQIVYLDPENPAPAYHTEKKWEKSLKTIYNERGKLRDSINDLYPDVFPNKVGDLKNLTFLYGKNPEKRSTSYYKNGNISMNREYLYGLPIGRQVNYNENNQLMSETNYILYNKEDYLKSRVDGLSETYFKGVLQETSTTEYGTIVGYYFGGTGQGFKNFPDFSYDYAEGNRIKEKHEEGELNVKSWFDGPVKFYRGGNRDPKEKLICEINFIEGEPDGKFTAITRFFINEDNPAVEIEFEYDNGKLLSKTKSSNGLIISKNVY